MGVQRDMAWVVPALGVCGEGMWKVPALGLCAGSLGVCGDAPCVLLRESSHAH